MNSPILARVHPGRIVRNQCFKPLNISEASFARKLGVTRQTINRLLNEHCGISTEMAFRLGYAFGTGPEIWINLQKNYDCAQMELTFNPLEVEVLTSPKVA